MSKKFKILDCTLRDGGYYTNWDFSNILFEKYIKSMNELPVDYIEIGYRNLFNNDYNGQFYYTPISTIDKALTFTYKPLVLIIDDRKIELNDIEIILSPCVDKIKMIRMAVDPVNIDSALIKAEKIKGMGFEVAFNLMYLSTWIEKNDIYQKFSKIEEKLDYLYLVDSFGSVYPDDLKKIILKIKKITNVKLGFHGHNNIELAFSNSLSAIKSGIDIIDSTILGMGRGAGNLKTELILSFINNTYKVSVDFNCLALIVEEFDELHKKYKWGINLPYILSGFNSIPQKKIMDWFFKKYYSFNSIINAINTKINNIESNYHFKPLSSVKKYKEFLIIGGGDSVKESLHQIKKFISDRNELLVIFSSAKHYSNFNSIINDHIVCLVGNENERLKLNNKNMPKFILPPKPRDIGTFLPENCEENTFEILSLDYLDKPISSHCSIAIQTAIEYNAKEIFLIGFDGYSIDGSQKEMDLFKENDFLFSSANKYGLKLISLTQTSYNNLIKNSIHFLI